MSDRDSSGIGCGGLFVVLVVLGLILEYWVQILLTVVTLAALGLIAMLLWTWATSAAERAAEKRACRVCNNWTPSVLLTDLGPDAALCTLHRARVLRLTALEQELLSEE